MQKWDSRSEEWQHPYLLVGREAHIKAFGSDEGYVPIVYLSEEEEKRAITLSIKTEDGQVIYRHSAYAKMEFSF